MWRERAAETFIHRAAEVVQQTVTERNYHTFQLPTLLATSAGILMDRASVCLCKNSENRDQEIQRRDGCVSVSVFIFVFCWFFFSKLQSAVKGFCLQ